MAPPNVDAGLEQPCRCGDTRFDGVVLGLQRGYPATPAPAEVASRHRQKRRLRAELEKDLRRQGPCRPSWWSERAASSIAGSF
jgi:hypothetical protein